MNNISLKNTILIIRFLKWRLFFIILLCTLLGVMISIFNIIPQKYQSTTLIRIKNNNTFAISGTANLTSNLGININSIRTNTSTREEYIELIKSRAVLEPVINVLDITEKEKEKMTVDDFMRAYLDIVNLQNTDLIKIVGYAETPQKAQEISKLVTDNFLSLVDKLNTNNEKFFNNEECQVIDAANVSNEENYIYPKKHIIICISFILGIVISIIYVSYFSLKKK